MLLRVVFLHIQISEEERRGVWGRKEEEGRGIVHMWLESVAYPINCSCSFSAYLNRRTLLSLANIRSWYPFKCSRALLHSSRTAIHNGRQPLVREDGRQGYHPSNSSRPPHIHPFQSLVGSPPLLILPVYLNHPRTLDQHRNITIGTNPHCRYPCVSLCLSIVW